MNRRGFVARVFGVLAVGPLAKYLPAPEPEPITFKGIPMIFDDGKTLRAAVIGEYGFTREELQELTRRIDDAATMREFQAHIHRKNVEWANELVKTIGPARLRVLL